MKDKMLKLSIIICLAALTIFISCATVPKGDPEQDAALKTFKVKPDVAGIYIYRNESLGFAVRMDVEVDGEYIGQTVGNTYLYTEVSPGKHTVTSKAENTHSIELDTVAIEGDVASWCEIYLRGSPLANLIRNRCFGLWSLCIARCVLHIDWQAAPCSLWQSSPLLTKSCQDTTGIALLPAVGAGFAPQ